MALRAVSRYDILKRLNRAGVAGSVQAAEVLQAVQLFVASELPEAINSIEPLYVKDYTIVVRSHSAVAAQALKQRQEELLQSINKACNTKITQLYFRV